jgi:hypothetical protein
MQPSWTAKAAKHESRAKRARETHETTRQQIVRAEESSAEQRGARRVSQSCHPGPVIVALGYLAAGLDATTPRGSKVPASARGGLLSFSTTWHTSTRPRPRPAANDCCHDGGALACLAQRGVVEAFAAPTQQDLSARSTRRATHPCAWPAGNSPRAALETPKLQPCFAPSSPTARPHDSQARRLQDGLKESSAERLGTASFNRHRSQPRSAVQRGLVWVASQAVSTACSMPKGLVVGQILQVRQCLGNLVLLKTNQRFGVGLANAGAEWMIGPPIRNTHGRTDCGACWQHSQLMRRVHRRLALTFGRGVEGRRGGSEAGSHPKPLLRGKLELWS